MDDRIAQLLPFTEYGIWNIPLWLVVSLGRAGDQGVQLFLIISGFGLTWALLTRTPSDLGWLRFFKQRFARIYPKYWMAHLFLLGGGLLLKFPIQSDSGFLLSLLGIRVTPNLLYEFSPAWWYIGLVIQLYLVFPLLWFLLTKLGWRRFLVLTLFVSLTIRTIGLWYFSEVVPEWGYLDAWARGAIFITRLPEFVFGMALAAAASEFSLNRVVQWLTEARTVIAAFVIYCAAMALSATLLGNGVAIFLLGASVFVLIFAALDATVAKWRWTVAPVRILSDRSYSIFLAHYPVIIAVVPVGIAISPRLFFLTGIILIGTFAFVIALDVATAIAQRLFQYLRQSSRRIQFGVIVSVAVVWALLVSAELWVRNTDPQEVNGWGERASLIEDAELGWRLIPNQQTRLRWQGYDYEVTSNALGFPGPEIAMDNDDDAFRIMTLGDAFTSAEGVDTELAWPRLLENVLSQTPDGRPIEVANFAVTGYGPNQHAGIAKSYLPAYQPDVVVAALFINEFEDVSISNRDFQRSIGFGKTPSDNLYAILALGHLSKWAQKKGRELMNLYRKRPSPSDVWHSRIDTFRPNSAANKAEARDLFRDRLKDLSDVAAAHDSKLIVLAIPANVQVCDPDDLYDQPHFLTEEYLGRLDLEGPQQAMTEDAASLGLDIIDLRPVLSGSNCPYKRENMHWNENGHERVATYLAELINETVKRRSQQP